MHICVTQLQWVKDQHRLPFCATVFDMVVSLVLLVHWHGFQQSWSALSTAHLAVNDMCQWHYSDVIMTAMAFQIRASRWFAQPCVKAQIKENIKALRQWEDFAGDQGIPAQRASDAENVSIWWCHHHVMNYGSDAVFTLRCLTGFHCHHYGE